MKAQHILADCNRVIDFNIRVILIMQKLYNLFFTENVASLFDKNNFSIYLVILSDLDNLKLGKLLDKLLWMFYKKNSDYTCITLV